MIRRVLFVVSGLAVALAIACSSQTKDSTATASGAAAAAKKAVATPAAIEHGRGIYKVNCAPCHGEGGKGDGPAAGVLKPAPRDHTDRAYMGTLTDEDLAKVIQMGGGIKGKPLMPSNPQIKGSDLDALVAFTRSLSTSKP
jgi:mono/diheme cytochrome c family protein